ncbi:hypothetical protein DyAD56_18620 [Dyella sp. AD56]|uniref:hypothetical protein n=1 Tax=Dyella sp. AD56 TaxID=1528744 RepID=UPI000C852AC7|nr:hypothetical protein [Dyella sp. AD56]PMQ03720.1 hypothetical protein DyAD56_18620 [Dyella sp. AD56]
MVAAIIALIATITGAFLGSLIAEDYRRFRDAQGTAASLSGELSSYVEGGQEMLRLLGLMKEATEAGTVLPFKEFEPPKDILYEAQAKNLGLLGADMAKDVAYVYQRINGFRTGYAILTRAHKELKPNEVASSLAACERMIKASQDRAARLLRNLDSLAAAEYEWPRLPRVKRKSVDH